MHQYSAHPAVLEVFLGGGGGSICRLKKDKEDKAGTILFLVFGRIMGRIGLTFTSLCSSGIR